MFYEVRNAFETFKTSRIPHNAFYTKCKHSFCLFRSTFKIKKATENDGCHVVPTMQLFPRSTGFPCIILKQYNNNVILR